MRAVARSSARDVESVAVIGAGVWDRLLKSHDLMLGELRRCLADDCTVARFELLSNLERQDGQTPAELSRRMRVTAGNLTGLVDRAERDGVAERRPDPADRRLSRVWLTNKGRGLVESLLPAYADHLVELLSVLDVGERRDLRRLLGKLSQSLHARKQL